MEYANLFFAGISAVMASIQVWQASRNQQIAVTAFDDRLKAAPDEPETIAAAEELLSIAPADVIEDLEGRAEKCWTKYREVLGGPFLPGEIDEATESVKACVCRELRRIKSINGGKIPDRWLPQWEAYDCSASSATLKVLHNFR
ncbi:MAG: hypothetical protein P4L68_05265 [Methylovirgula sp.]|nr:hypothetical protein [Methylovirgula sp.]